MQNETTQVELNEMLDAAWDDDLMDETETDTPAEDADQQPAEPEAEEQQNEAIEDTAETEDGQEQPEDQGAESQTEPAPEMFTLRYMQEDKQFSREEVIAYAQKGFDYDRIRRERDSLKAESPTLNEYKGFLEELAKDSNTTVDKLIEDIRTNRLVHRETAAGRTITELAAREQIQRERTARLGGRQEQPAEQPAASQENKPQTGPNPDVLAFCRAYPDVQPKDIPQAVWDDVRSGSDLVSAYTRYENKQLRSQLETLKQNEKNKNRSTGSRQSSGGSTAKSDFDKAWDDADF